MNTFNFLNTRIMEYETNLDTCCDLCQGNSKYKWMFYTVKGGYRLGSVWLCGSEFCGTVILVLLFLHITPGGWDVKKAKQIN